jgi:hypothetical protein
MTRRILLAAAVPLLVAALLAWAASTATTGYQDCRNFDVTYFHPLIECTDDARLMKSDALRHGILITFGLAIFLPILLFVRNRLSG